MTDSIIFNEHYEKVEDMVLIDNFDFIISKDYIHIPMQKERKLTVDRSVVTDWNMETRK